MARVTKINVGGTNYDIAHEGELKNSGFEVVTSLPTTGLFAGREVIYNGKKYVYSSGWKEEITANTMYEANLLWGGRNIQSGASPIDACLNPNRGNNIFGFFPAENIVIERSVDGGQTWGSSEISNDKKILLFTKDTELSVGYDMVRITLDCHGVLYGTLMKIIISMSTGLAEDCYCRVQGLTYYKSANGLTGDTDYVNIAESQLIGWTNDNTINFSPVTVGYHSMTDDYNYYRYLRFIFRSSSGHHLYIIKSIYGYTQQTYNAASEFQKTGKLYTYDAYKNAYFPAKVESKELINFDVNNIEPTQTGSSEYKTSTWLWQYLVQAVNWLKANNVRLSAYNTKVATLEQADSDNNASIQSVSTDLTELSNSLASVATSGSYNDLTDKPTLATVATSGSYNDLTDKPALYEANLLWGGRNIANSFSPIDAGMMSELSANVMAFPNPAGISIEYSRDGGVTWLDYGVTDAQKINFFTSRSELYCGKSGPDGLAANVEYMLRVTINPMECGLYADLNKAIMRISSDNSDGCWCTLSALTQTDYNLGNISDDYYKVFVNKAAIGGWPAYNVLNFRNLGTSNQTADSTSKHRLVRFTFGYDSVVSNPAPGYNGLRIFSIKLFGLGRYELPSNLARTNHLYTYDSLQNALFPAKVESKEVINFDINNIEPTQTGNVTKTSTWLWQYLVQGVNWLKANKFSGSYNDLTDKPTLFNGSYDDLTNKPNLATVATSGSYDDLLNKPALVFQNIGGTISSVQIPDGLIANAKLANPSMSLNGTTVNLGDTSILPWYVDYNEVDYPARIRDHWLQIYRNGVWANLMYLGDILPTQVGQITSLADLDWYNEQVSEYEVDSTTTTSILNGTTLPATVLMNCLAERLTLNLYPISGKQYGKGSLDSLITDLQGKGFSVFVENDLDTILQSGSDYLVRIKISKVPTYKAIIECYVSR